MIKYLLIGDELNLKYRAVSICYLCVCVYIYVCVWVDVSQTTAHHTPQPDESSF